MGRRSDHSRDELERLILSTGHALLAEHGFARFSAREVAKRVGYSVGTIYNVFGTLDAMLVAINTRTFELWAEHLRSRLAEGESDRLRALVEGYFAFAAEHRNLWMAIYDHRLPDGMAMPQDDARRRAELTRIVAAEIATALPDTGADQIEHITYSLVATVHGHCSFALTGTFALLGEDDPAAAALARVREAIAAHAQSEF